MQGWGCFALVQTGDGVRLWRDLLRAVSRVQAREGAVAELLPTGYVRATPLLLGVSELRRGASHFLERRQTASKGKDQVFCLLFTRGFECLSLVFS